MRADNLAAELGSVPDWFDGFVAHLARVHRPAAGAALVSALGIVLAEGASTHPQAVLERARRPGRSIGPLARALQDYLVTHRLALPTDDPERRAAARRQRRIEAVPTLLRPPVAGFADSLLAARQRARRAQTKPRSDATVEHALATIRDLAQFLAARGMHDWALVATGDVEAFLASRGPGHRPRTLTVARQFFGWTRARRLILIDPTRGIRVRQTRGFTGATVSIQRQRALFARWTGDPSVHPHEALVGLLALLHGAASREIRGLTVADIDLTAATIQLGSRPRPIPLDPPTRDVVQRCIQHRQGLRTANPHLLVTRGTKADSRPASPAYLTHVLDPVGLSPRALRMTRLAELVNTMDPKLVAAAYGMKPEGVLDYLADHVDPARLAEPEPNPSTFGAT